MKKIICILVLLISTWCYADNFYFWVDSRMSSNSQEKCAIMLQDILHDTGLVSMDIAPQWCYENDTNIWGIVLTIDLEYVARTMGADTNRLTSTTLSNWVIEALETNEYSYIRGGTSTNLVLNGLKSRYSVDPEK